jgi:ATP-dependent DNA ligase
MGSSDRQHELAVFAFDLLHYDGADLRPVPLIERRLQLTELLARSSVHCLHLVQAFDDGAKLLEAAERRGLEGIVSKCQASAYSLGGQTVIANGWKGSSSPRASRTLRSRFSPTACGRRW